MFQLLAESSSQKISKLEARVDVLAKQSEAAQRELTEATAMTAQLLGVISDMQHTINNLSNAMQAVLDKD